MIKKISRNSSSDARRLQCADVNKPLQKDFKRVYAVYTYSNGVIYQLLSC